MSNVRMPNIFKIRETIPDSVPTASGRRYDLNPYLRVDLTGRIRHERPDLHYLLPESSLRSKVINFPENPNTSDFFLQKVFRTAWEFGFVDRDTNEYVNMQGWDRSLYEAGLSFGWYSPYLMMDLKAVAHDEFDPKRPVKLTSKLHTNYAELYVPKEDLKSSDDIRVMEISCKEGLIRSLFRKSSNPTLKPSQQKPNIIWLGDLHNFWDIFSKQIDDRSDPIESLRINPDGFFALKYKNGGGIDLERAKYAAMVGAICQNIPYLELNFIRK